MTVADLWGIALLLSGGLFAWWLASKLAEAPDRAFVARMVALSFGLRAGWSIFQHIIYPPVWKMVAADAIARYRFSVAEAELWRLGIGGPTLPETLSQAHEQLIRLQVTCMVYVFGPSPMVAEALPITLNVTIVIAIYLICRQIGATRRAAYAATALAALLPSLIFWSTQIIKDPVTGACIAWSTVAMLKVGHRAHGGWLVLLIVADFLAIVYRPYVGILLVVGQGLAWGATVKLPPTALGKVTRVAMFVVMTPVVLQIGIREMQETYGEGMNLEWAVDQYMSFRQSGIDLGDTKGSEYEIPLTADSPTEAILQLPIRVLLLLLTPIPIFPGPLRKMFVFPEMWFIYLFVVPRFVAGFQEAWRKNRLALVTILLILAPLVVSYALKTAVSGEAIRMRSQFLPLLLIFAGIGHAVYQQRQKERRRGRSSLTPAGRYAEVVSEVRQKHAENEEEQEPRGGNVPGTMIE